MPKNNYELKNVSHFNKLTINKVENNSIAEEIELEPGDRVLSIDNNPVIDDLDFYFYTIADQFLLEIEKESGEIWEIEIEKEPDEDMGISFYEKETKTCQNNCVFCFIDQLPTGLRETLYVKDDDERLSFITGNYVTLTNLNQEEIKRICKWKIPINVSIHSTDPVIRKKMLRHKEADQIMDKLKILSEANVNMKGQIVLVPDLNDQDLIRTLKDLVLFYPNLESVSVVPVGLTQFRDRLSKLRIFTKEEALEIIDQVEKLQSELLEKIGTRFVFLSDEFYILAGLPIPEQEYYESFKQYENGVGMIRSFLTDFDQYFPEYKENTLPKNILLITGNSFYPFLKEKIEQINAINFKNVRIKCIENKFFGKNINVAGLITGQDILSQLSDEDLNNLDKIILPDVMFKADSELFLDDKTIKDLEESLNKEIKIVQSEAKALLEEIYGE